MPPRYVPAELDTAVDEMGVSERFGQMKDDFLTNVIQPAMPTPQVELPTLDFESALEPFKRRVAEQTQQVATGFQQTLGNAYDQFAQRVTGGAAPGGGASVPLDMSTPEAYKASLMANAQQIASKYDLPANIIAAIPIQEAGYQGSDLTRRGNNLFSIKGQGPAGSVDYGGVWEVENGQDVSRPASFRKYNSASESFEDFAKLMQTDRYRPAVEAWQRTRDPNAFIQAVQAAGYATDPTWAGKVGQIAREMPASIDPEKTGRNFASLGAGNSADVGSIPPPGQSTSQQFAAGSLTPDQFNSGLSTADAYAACGVVAAVAFARKFGRNPTVQEATNLAKQYGWSPEQGMGRGTAGTVDTANALGAAVKAGPVDDARIAADVQRGNPVGINLGGGPGNNGHFMVAERYDPSTGKFDFGNTAKALKASGGNTWFTLAELPRLGFGSPRDAIYADAPDSPSPSVVAGQSKPVNTVKGMPIEQAMAADRGMAQLDLSGGPPARDDWRLDGRNTDTPEPDVFRGAGSGEPVAGSLSPPSANTQQPAGPAIPYGVAGNVESGDFSIPGREIAPSSVGPGRQPDQYGVDSNVTTAPPSPQPDGAVEPSVASTEAPAPSSGNPIVDGFNALADGLRNLGGLIGGANKTAVDTLNQAGAPLNEPLANVGEQLGNVSQTALDVAQMPQQARKAALDFGQQQIGTALNESRIGYQNALSDATGGFIPEGSENRTRQEAIEVSQWATPGAPMDLQGVSKATRAAFEGTFEGGPRAARAASRGFDLSPSPSMGIVDNARDTAGAPPGLTAAAGRTVGTGVAAGYEESQQEGATPESIARAGLEAGGLAALNEGGRRVLGSKRAVGVLNRAVAQSSEEDITHVKGFGILRGVDDDARSILERVAVKGRQFPEGVGFDEMDDAIKATIPNVDDVAKKWGMRDTRQAAAEVEVLRRGAAATLQEFMDDTRRITDFNDSSPDVILGAADRLADVAMASEWLTGTRRAAESAGRALNMFRNPIHAQIGRELFQGMERSAKDVIQGAKVLDDIGTGKAKGPRAGRILDQAADSLDALGKQSGDAEKVLTREQLNNLKELASGPERATPAKRPAPYVDPLAHQMKVREDMKRALDNALQKALETEKRINIRTEIEDMGRQARETIGQIIENTSDMALRDDLAETLGRMREHSNIGEQAASRLQGVFDQRMDTWAKNFSAGVDKRVASAEKSVQRTMDTEAMTALSTKLREMATLVRSGNRDERLMTGIDDMRIALMDYGKLGNDRAYDVKQSITRQGLLRYAGKIDEDKVGEFVTLLRSIDPERPETMRHIMSLMSKGTFTDSMIEYAIANMLSSPSTGMINVTSNAMQGAASLAIKRPLEVLLDPLVNRGNRQVYASELKASGEGLVSAFGTGLQAAGETMMHGFSRGTMERAAQLGDFGGVRRELLTEKFGPAGALLHAISTRPLQAADELFGSMLYSANLYALAERRAIQTGVKRTDILSDLAGNLDLVNEAGKKSDYSLLKSKDRVTNMMATLNRVNKGDGTDAAVAIASHILFPFVRTPWNVLKQGIEFSPAGTVVNAGKLATNAATGGDALRRTDLAANVASGLGMAALGSTLWAGGNISGDGPTDLEKRKMLESEGWRPRSIRVGDQWVSYDSTPFTIPLGSLVTGLERYQEAVEKGEAKGSPDAMWKAVQGFGIGTASSFLNQSFVKNAADIYEDVRGGQFKPESLGTNLVTRYIPAGSMVAYLSRLGDSVQRETRMVDDPSGSSIVERTPFRGTLPEKPDVLGRAMPNDQRAPSGFLPAPRRSTIREDPVISAFQSAGVDIGAPPSEMTIGGGKAKLELSSEERRAWMAARGEYLTQFAGDVGGPDWEALAPERRAQILRKVLSDAGEYAQRSILASLDRDAQKTEERLKVPAGVR